MKVYFTTLTTTLLVALVFFAGVPTAAFSSSSPATKVQALHSVLSRRLQEQKSIEKKEERSVEVQQLPGDDGVGDGAGEENPNQSFDVSDFNFKDPKCMAAITTWSTTVSSDCTTEELANFGKAQYTDAEASDFYEKFATSKCSTAMGKKFADLGTHCIGATAEIAARFVEASVTRGSDGKLCGVEFQRVSRYQNCNNATNSSECVKMQGCAVAQELREGANGVLPNDEEAVIPPPQASATRTKFTCDAKAEARKTLCNGCLKSVIEKNADLIDQVKNQKMVNELREAALLCDPAEAPVLLTSAVPAAFTESPEDIVAPPATAPLVTFDFGDGIGDGKKVDGGDGDDVAPEPTTPVPTSRHHRNNRNHHNRNSNNNNHHHQHNNVHHDGTTGSGDHSDVNKGTKKTKPDDSDDLGAQNSVAPNPLATSPSAVHKSPSTAAKGHSGKASSSATTSSSSSSAKGAVVGVLGVMVIMSLVVIAILLHQKRQRFNRRRRGGGFTNPNEDDIDIESDVDDLDYGNEPATAASATMENGGDGSGKSAGVQVGQIVMDDGTVASLPAVLANATTTNAVAPAPPVVLPTSAGNNAAATTRFDDPKTRPSMPESPVINDGV